MHTLALKSQNKIGSHSNANPHTIENRHIIQYIIFETSAPNKNIKLLSARHCALRRRSFPLFRNINSVAQRQASTTISQNAGYTQQQKERWRRSYVNINYVCWMDSTGCSINSSQAFFQWLLLARNKTSCSCNSIKCLILLSLAGNLSA